MTTIYDVAKEAKVSIKTVSRVMNEEHKVKPTTKKIVLEAMKVLDYSPSFAARTMVTQKTGLIGLITSAITSSSKIPELAGLPAIDLVKGIQSVIEASGKTLMIADTGGRIPFGRAVDIDMWSIWIRKGLTKYSSYKVGENTNIDFSDETIIGLLLPLVSIRNNSTSPIDDYFKIKSGDIITFLINTQKEEDANEWLKEKGFKSGPVARPGLSLF